jgi:N-acetylated-alpha-linked acidic dipeptidase
VTEVARDVEDPQRKVSVLERLRAYELTQASSTEQRKEIRDRGVIRLDALGSGSDYTPFLQHAGIASLSIGYGGEAEYGVYHSAYDSFDHYLRFGDPNFDYGIALAKTTGRMMLRLANADLLPFEASTLASTVARYAGEVETLAARMRDDAEERNRQLRERTMELAADPTKPFVAPKAEEPVPYLEFAPLENAVARLQKAAKEFDAAANRDDKAVMRLERALTREEGLPGRPWYKHHVYAPGFYTGYGVKTLPAVREAIEQKKWSEANQQIVVTARVIEGYAQALEAAIRASS